ncbi:DUF1365 domain-containing protein [Williamsia sterculiae]|uniref:DUF1365 family protein n=1 Tax=Williamsia sterculiae TaxID=1344003 RepID=A0A1N7H2J4_9NOCA|nr:DUF1365 domain-containing protein [Williamsia sterculiae]SIS19023.1 hypothetical protein SAMN05445060_3418 [Williamsia sterculiae]
MSVAATAGYDDLPALPAIVDGVVRHRRMGPVAHAFRHRAYEWLVDLDHPPRPGALLSRVATFRAGDHLGAPPDDDRGTAVIKANVLRYLATNHIDLGPDPRIVMLANARVLGYVFDPLSMYWCHDATGRLRCLVAEVHNTYGERTAYLLEPDDDGRSQVEKTFYVSPFNDVSGRYEIRATATPARVAVSITLHRDGREPFVATFTGVPRPATRGATVRAVTRMPLMPQRARGLITVHGIWLWARGLRIVPRPVHHPPKEV